MEDPERHLADEDVKAIVAELKSQLLKDFQLEVGRGVWGWVKKAAVLILLLLAVQGILTDKNFVQSVLAGGGGAG